MFRICTPQLLLLSLLVDAQYLWWFHSNKKTFVAIAWDEMVLSHKVRSFVWFTVPLETNSVVHYDRQCQIYLKVVTARMVIQILFPLFLSNVTFDKKTHHNIRCVDYPYPVQHPAENSQVVSIRADCRRVVCTIPIISVNSIVISDVIRLRLWSNNRITCTFPLDTPLDCQIITPSNFVIWKKRYLFFVLPCCALQVVMCSPLTKP
jgi:hypothetical protein